ncbi:MAG: mechanosensitive ion channel, partial [Gammaproteobacteria bacterium]|nr:mechanosensitive ion channel [Gammaproteobacteria bacterium]
MFALVLARACRVGALAALALASTGAMSQGTQPPVDDPAAHRAVSPATAPAEVIVQNRVVAVMRATIFGYSPAERARAASRRIRDILAKDGAGRIEVRERPEGRGFTIDGDLAFFLTPRDVNPFAGETIDSIAHAAQKNLEVVVREHLERRDPKAMSKAILLAALATLVFAVLIRLIFVANRRLRYRISARLAERARGVKIGGVHALDFGHFLRGVRHLVTGLTWALAALVTYIWIVYVFDRFPHTRAWGEQLLEHLLDTVEGFFGAIAGSVPGLLTVVVIFFVARWLTQLSAAFFSRVASGRVATGWLDSETAGPTRRIVNVVVWLFALAMAYPYLPGAGTDAFKGLSVLVGLMISIGASNLVGQAASGLILMYARSFRAGEFVRIGDTEGTVFELGLFSTRLRTGAGEEVMLPNSLVLSQSSKNYSRAAPGSSFVVSTTVTIGYATPWRQVHAMLIEAARRTRDI